MVQINSEVRERFLECSFSPAERQSIRIEYSAREADERVIRLLNLLERAERQSFSRKAKTAEMESRLTRRPSLAERKEPLCATP